MRPGYFLSAGGTSCGSGSAGARDSGWSVDAFDRRQASSGIGTVIEDPQLISRVANMSIGRTLHVFPHSRHNIQSSRAQKTTACDQVYV